MSIYKDTRKCYFDCVVDGALHRFPSAHSFKWEIPQQIRYEQWIKVLDQNILKRGDGYIKENVFLCSKHFEDKYVLPSGHLTQNAVPSLNKCRGSDSIERTGMASNTVGGQKSQMPRKKSNLNNASTREARRKRIKRAHQLAEQIESRNPAQRIRTAEGHAQESQEQCTKNMIAEVLDKEEQLDEKYKGGPVIPAPYEMFRCNVCNASIAGFRYTCVQCSDLDLCGACEAARAHHHHYVLRVPADRLAAEVQLVLAVIRRDLMRNLDPITQHGQDQDDAISFKSEVKLEPEDYEYNDNDGENYNDDTKNKLLEDGVLKKSSSPGPPQHRNFGGEAQSVDGEDEAPRGECGEVQGKRKPTNITYLNVWDYLKIEERGLPWDAQPRAEEVVIPSEATPPRPRVLYASTQMQRKFTGMLQDMNQKDLQTKIMKAQDIDEDPLSQVKIVQTSLIDAGQLDLVDSKIVATGARRDILPRVRTEAIARDVQSNMGLPGAHRVKPECSAKLKRLQSQALAHAGNKPVVSVTTDPRDSKTTIPTTSTHKAEKRTKIIEQAESGDTRHTVSVKKRCLSSDMSRDTTKTTLVQSDINS